MNLTDDEPQTETDVMASAFSTMRKCGMNILTATCKNRNWSWSFISHDRQIVIFGA